MAALSGPLSKRRLGTRSGDLRRLARGAMTPQGRAAADQAAIQAKLDEGSAISSSEGNILADSAERRARQGIAQRKMDLLTGTTRAATGGLLEARQKLFGEAKQAGGFSDEMKERGRALGITDSGFSLAQSKITGGTPATTPANTGSVAGNPAVTKPTLGVPVLGGVLDATPPRPREGRINGMPASQALSKLRTQGTPQEYGSDIAKRNVETLGFKGALEDFRRREALDAERLNRAPEEPGNLRAMIPQVGPAKPGPLTMAANQTLTDKRLREAGEAAVSGPPKSAMPIPQVGPPASAMSIPQVGPPSSAMPLSEVGPPTSAMAPTPARRRLIDARNRGARNPNDVAFESPLAAMRDRYKTEEDRNLKTPLRSAWLAAGSGIAAAGRNLTQTY